MKKLRPGDVVTNVSSISLRLWSGRPFIGHRQTLLPVATMAYGAVGIVVAQAPDITTLGGVFYVLATCGGFGWTYGDFLGQA